MASYNKFNSFVEALAEKVHNLGADVLTAFLTTNANTPVATNSQLSNITQIAYTNLSTRVLGFTSSAQTSGTYKLILTDLVLTATGAVATFRMIGIYNDTATNDELICWFDWGSDVTLASGDTFTLDFDGTNGVLQIAPPSGGGGGVSIGNGWNLIAHAAGYTDVNSASTSATPIDTTGADLLIAVVGHYDIDITSGVTTDLVDSKGNVWTALTDRGGSGQGRVSIFYCKPTSVGAGHTFTFTHTTAAPSIAVMAVSGSHATPYDLDSGAHTTSGTSLATGSITPTVASDLVIAALGALTAEGSTPTIDNAMTALDHVPAITNVVGGHIAYKTQAAAAAINPTWSWTTAIDASAAIAAFKHS